MVPTERIEKIILGIHFEKPWNKLRLQGVKEVFVKNYCAMVHIGESTPCRKFVKKICWKIDLDLEIQDSIFVWEDKINSAKEIIFVIHCLKHSLEHSSFDIFFRFSESNTLQ